MNEWTHHRRELRHADRADLYVTALQRYFAAEAVGKTPATCKRYERVLAHLLRYFDTVDVEQHLGTGPAALLAGERQFVDANAFFRVFGFDELVACLPGFVAADWMLPKRGDSRSQLRLTNQLLARLRRDRLIDMGVVGCAYLESEAAVARARRRLNGGYDHDDLDDLDWPPEPATLRVIRGGLAE